MEYRKMKEVNAPNCGRENDLIAFLYSELNDLEARTFQSHMHDCPGCSAELETFKDIRESVVNWRNESLGLISESAAAKVIQEKPSPLAALREFFNLAPLWVKGALATASLLFLVFAGLAVARLREQPAPVVVNNQFNNSQSEQQLKAQVANLEDQLQRLTNSLRQSPPSFTVKETPQRIPSRRLAGRSEFASVPKARRPLSKSEREQLAADLRLISGKGDSDIDLLGDRINQ